MARSLIRRALRRELFPTFGLPTMAVLTPCSSARPRKAVLQQVRQLRPDGTQADDQRLPVQRVHVLVGEIHGGLDLRKKPHQLPSQGPKCV